MSGRDAGLSKSRTKATASSATGKSSAKHQSAIDKLNEHRKIEADRMELKRQRDHDLRLEQQKTKRLKYEYKKLAAEADRTSRIDELRLQIELARASTGTVPSTAMTQPVASTSRLSQSSSSSGMPSTSYNFDMDNSSEYQASSEAHSVFSYEDYPPYM